MSPTSPPRFRDVLPSCYRQLLPAFFDTPRPEEPYAPCDRCTMLPPPGVAPESGRFFRPDTKCCTYHPFLPNYAVGGLLAAEETGGSLGRQRIRERIAQGEGVVPAGIRPSARCTRRYRELGALGIDRPLRCPYYDEAQGACSVWAFREANCTTWFCKFKHGRDGVVFWSSVRSYLQKLERVLARHCLRELGFSRDRIEQAAALPDTEDAASREEGPEGEAGRRALWGDWLGREQELYVVCYRTVLAVDAAELSRLGGGELQGQPELLEQALRSMQEPGLPERLRRNPAATAVRGPDGWLVTGYSPYDPVQMSDAVWSALSHFDGTTSTDTARAASGHRLSDALLARLVQLAVLVPAD